MTARFAIIALGAACCLFSGCGCSKEKPTAPVPQSRMADPAYTNRLVKLHDKRAAVAAEAAAIREQIKKLGADAAQKPEYAELTNRLAQCKEAVNRIRRETSVTIRTRILQESVEKGNLKKK